MPGQEVHGTNPGKLRALVHTSVAQARHPLSHGFGEVMAIKLGDAMERGQASP